MNCGFGLSQNLDFYIDCIIVIPDSGRDVKRMHQKVVSHGKLVTRFSIAIHGFWMPAFPAGMTRCLNTYAFKA